MLDEWDMKHCDDGSQAGGSSKFWKDQQSFLEKMRLGLSYKQRRSWARITWASTQHP